MALPRKHPLRVALAVALVLACLACAVGATTLLHNPDPKIRFATMGIFFVAPLVWSIIRAIRANAGSAERARAISLILTGLEAWTWLPFSMTSAKRDED